MLRIQHLKHIVAIKKFLCLLENILKTSYKIPCECLMSLKNALAYNTAVVINAAKKFDNTGTVFTTFHFLHN